MTDKCGTCKHTYECKGVIPKDEGRKPLCPENLCDFCVLDFATCDSLSIIFGKGEGNYNVISCGLHREPF